MDATRLRKLLNQRRDALVREGDIAFETEAGNDDTARKPDEDAAPLAEMNQVIASKRNLRRAQELEQIATALARLDDDPEDIGCCDDCGDDIPKRRLELMPWVRLCISCQETRERNAAPTGRKHITDYE